MKCFLGIIGVLLTASLTACGGGGGGGGAATPSGPSAVVNGSTLATATTHWVSNGCGCYGGTIEIAADGGVKSNYCNWGIVTGTWTAINGGTTMLISYSSGNPAQYYFTSIKDISGTTESGTFTGQGVNNIGDIEGCTFSLVAAPL